MAREIVSGIYKIESLSNPQRIYIGSANDIYKRWTQHKGALARGQHSSKKLQRHYYKHGLLDLNFSIVAVCDKNELMSINNIIRPEQFFIWAYNPWFNNSPTAGSNMGCKMSKKAKSNMSSSAKKRRASEETKRKMSERMKGNTIMNGRHLSEETKQKMSLVRTGKKMPKEFCEWRSKVMQGNKICLGHKHTDETKELLRQKNLGKKYSEESKKKMSESHKGKKLPIEQCNKISESLKKRWHGK